MNNLKPAGVTISDLLNCLEGEILNCHDKSGERVESLMIGAMCVDPAPLYFNLKPDKAVITRCDRTDIQLGALETPMKCLILTGGRHPSPGVLQRAEEQGIPVLLVEKDTPATILKLEQGLNQPVSEDQAPEKETAEVDKQG